MANKFTQNKITEIEKEFDKILNNEIIEINKDQIINTENKNYTININKNSNILIISKLNTTKLNINIKKNIKTSITQIIINSKIITNINLNSKSNLKHQKIIINSNLNNTNTTLNENSEYELNQTIYATENESFNNTCTTNNGENTSSIMNLYSISKNSLIVNDGLIKINEGASNSQGVQNLKNLILKDGKIHSMPNLEILNNNVKCSHGCTISNIDNDNYFYLKTKGLDENQIQKLLIKSYLNKTLNNVPKQYLENVKSLNDIKNL